MALTDLSVETTVYRTDLIDLTQDMDELPEDGKAVTQSINPNADQYGMPLAQVRRLPKAAGMVR